MKLDIFLDEMTMSVDRSRGCFMKILRSADPEVRLTKLDLKRNKSSFPYIIPVSPAPILKWV
jgi:hypothetical protein